MELLKFQATFSGTALGNTSYFQKLTSPILDHHVATGIKLLEFCAQAAAHFGHATRRACPRSRGEAAQAHPQRAAGSCFPNGGQRAVQAAPQLVRARASYT